MREMINYMAEANLALLLFLLFYKVMVKSENHFSLMRWFVLASMICAVCFPLIHLTAAETALPAIGEMVPAHWLPEVVITAGPGSPRVTVNNAYDAWEIAGWAYLGGVVVFGTLLAAQLISFLRMVRNSNGYSVGRCRVIECDEDKPTFSFFNIIFIGRAGDLNAQEKRQVISHEQVHARNLHSIDILLVSLLRIAFWFNPFIVAYKKILVQLHEFEADARAVGSSDVNNYCSLLAKVALQSADLAFASHFNQSLTLKRINMMRTIKKPLQRWKIAAMALTICVTFIIVSCQDQINEITASTISQVAFPPQIQPQVDAYMKEHPNAKLTYMEGLPGEVDKFANSPEVKPRIVYNYTLSNGAKGLLLTDVVQFAETLQTKEEQYTEEPVFMVVEQAPEYPGGFDALGQFISSNLKYPVEAQKAGVSGTVYISMIIDKEGNVINPNVLRGVEASLDAEALRVIKAMPKWKPGFQNGKAVYVRFNIPIRFSRD